jgi:DNA modification methylase
VKKEEIQDSRFKIQDCNDQELQVDSSGQGILNFESDNFESKNSPVTCLGMEFPDDEARRSYFLDKLREFLADPEFRKIEGFPIGEDEDILNLSDPPYYTACPNPFIADFIKHYGKPYDPNVPYSKEPFAADVSEGKNDPIYNAHSYHTKVPHKAIMRYILHYTEPGDVVFDGFCGTGMTGVAAQLCGDRKTVESLGYRVDDQGVIYQQEEETDESGKKRTVWKPFSRLGARRAVLNDLSPAATFIAYNYNTPVNVQAFEREAKRILKEVENECGWMYATLASPEDGEPEAWADKLRACKTADEIRELLSSQSSLLRDGPTWGRINYTVWSDVFVCPECTQEVVFWEAAVDKEAGKVHSEFPCPHCGASLTKRNMDRAWATKYDKAIGRTIRQAKQVPVLINYSVGKKRYEKTTDAFDMAIIEKIEQLDIPYWFPTDRMPEGEESRRNDDIGLTHAHHFYTKRSLWVLDAFVVRAKQKLTQALWVATACTEGSSRLNRERPFGLPSKLSGTLYVSSMIREINTLSFLRRKISKYETRGLGPYVFLSAYSSSVLSNSDSSIDYIFTDPPFGGNLMYSELNFLWEAWFKVFTNNKTEAIANKAQKKGLPEYQRLMTECFKECYRVLKPGRWMTVEFHNSKNSVWNTIQEALQTAGFVIADVRTLDKKQGSFKQVTSASAVKQDLIISAYKPNGGLEDRFKLIAGTEDGVWDYIRTHLGKLAPPAIKNGSMEINPERMNYLLFDRMVAFHVQRGVTVPLSAAEFYAGLAQRFPERDGMYFLPEQVAEYDKKRMKVKEVLQLQLFVTDEASAIQWLKQQLTRKPQTFQEIQPQFLRELHKTKHEKLPELSELLEQNFLRYDGKGEVPSQIHSYLSSNFKELRNLPKDDERLRAKAKDRWYVPDPNKASDLEKLRERALLREFEEYRKSKQKRLKVFRLEAVRAGFKKAWQERDYATIIAVARKIPESVLQEDPKLLMWFTNSLTRMEDE